MKSLGLRLFGLGVNICKGSVRFYCMRDLTKDLAAKKGGLILGFFRRFKR